MNKIRRTKDRPHAVSPRKLMIWFMILVLLVAMVAQQVYNNFVLQSVTDDSLDAIYSSLERDTRNLASDLFAVYSVPSVVEQSQEYQTIRYVRSDVLPPAYYTMLSGLQDVVSDMYALYRNMDVCQAYFPNSNGTGGTLGSSGDIVELLKQTLVFSQTEPAQLAEQLKVQRAVRLLPVERIAIGRKESEQYLPVIAGNMDGAISVLALMPLDEMLSYFDEDLLENGATLRLFGIDDQLLLSYPDEVSKEMEQKGHVLSCEMHSVQARAELILPEDYFSQRTQILRLQGIELLLILAAVGFILLLFLPDVYEVQDKKLRQEKEDPESTERQQEERIENLSLLQHRLGSNLLFQVMSGGVLTEEEERTLRGTVMPGVETFYILVVRSSNELNAAISRQLTPEDIGGSLVSISESEVGIFLPGDEGKLEALINRLEHFAGEWGAFYCGVSAACMQPEDIYTAVRQARNAVPREPGVRRYVEEASVKTRNRMLYERLFQSVVAQKEDAFQKTFEEIWLQSPVKEYRDTFYNVRFMLRNAVEELDMGESLGGGPDYDEKLQPRENTHLLKEYAQQVFRCAQERKNLQVNNRKNGVLAYVQNRAFDSELCVALVAEKQGLSERRVYDIVREMTGMTFNNYLTMLRMKRVGQLLYATQLSIWEVAQRCGYQSESTFYRTFHKYYGMSPSAYRANGERTGEEEPAALP